MNNVKYLFQSLYKNQVILDGRKKPWYFSIVMFVLGFFMMWVPILAKGYTTYCASALFNTSSTTNQEIDQSLLRIFKGSENDNYFQTVEFVKNSKTGSMNLKFGFANDEKYYDTVENSVIAEQIDDEYRAKNSKPLLKSTFSYTSNNQTYGIPYYYDVIVKSMEGSYKQLENTDTVTYEDKEHSNNNIILLQAYYLDLYADNSLPSDYDDTNVIAEFTKKVILRTSDDNSSINNFPHSFIVFAPNRIYLNIYSMHSSKSNKAINGYQGRISEGLGDDVLGKTLYSELMNDTQTKANQTEKDEQIYQNFANMLHKMAFPSNVKTVWFNIAIISAVYVGTILLMSGLLIFMHKRKSSAYKDTTYWEALKEAMTMSFTPSIICLAVGFYNYMFQITLLVMFNLFRAFFMYSKIVPPMSAQNNKPLYQARQ